MCKYVFIVDDIKKIFEAKICWQKLFVESFPHAALDESYPEDTDLYGDSGNAEECKTDTKDIEPLYFDFSDEPSTLQMKFDNVINVDNIYVDWRV